MKTKIIAAVCSVMLLFSACTTVQQDSFTKILARRATVEAVKAKPEYRTAFVLSVAAVDAVLGNPDATRDDLVAVLQTLKIKELKGADGALLIADILDSVDIAIGDKPLVGGGFTRLRSFILSLNEGMREGLVFSAAVK